MGRQSFDTELEDLPKVLPVFPLSGVVLMPGGRLPLNVFEPRYLALVMDALGQGRHIGMIQPMEAESETLYQVGCLSRISAFSEMEDGQLLISLTGLCRFQLGEEQPLKDGYRSFEVNTQPFLADLQEDIDVPLERDYLLDLVGPYLQREELDLDPELLSGFTNGGLISTLSMICPFAPQEKQALLEADTPGDRGELLTALIEMDNLSGGAPGSVKQ